ncbi:MAG: 4'-phosphopantetheinyl transferase superfamily protein [Lachnospiraceae bacterium]|nr:4'-phosphopantetheinyl transferase superfamily protein [Lachnospiraceae bacterium]
METIVKYILIDEKIKYIDLRKYLYLVSAERQERIKKYLFDKDKITSLTAELLIRKEACRTLGISDNKISFSYNEFGKPYLSNYPEYYFSISHSEQCITFTHSNCPIGIDVEKVSEHDFDVAEKFFTNGELNYLQESENKDIAFYDIWTKKEAYTKMLGTGLMTPLSSFDVTDKELRKNFVSKYISGYMINVCSKNLKEKNFDLVFEEINLYELLKCDCNKISVK